MQYHKVMSLRTYSNETYYLFILEKLDSHLQDAVGQSFTRAPLEIVGFHDSSVSYIFTKTCKILSRCTTW